MYANEAQMNSQARQQLQQAMLTGGRALGDQPRQSEIEGEMNSIASAIDRLGARCETLRGRIMTISRPSSPPNTGKTVSPVQSTDMGRALASIAERLNAISDSVDDDIQRLEL